MGACVGPQWTGIVTSSIETSAHQLDHNQSKLAYEMDSWDLYEAVGWGEPITVIDGRSAQAYARAHIPGATSLPHREICLDSTKSLDRSRDIVRAVRGSWQGHLSLPDGTEPSDALRGERTARGRNGDSGWCC